MSEYIPKFLLKDILNCIDKIIGYTDGYDYPAFLDDKRTIDAVIWNIDVMGEAANRMPDYFLHQYPDIPWGLIIATRNRIIHGYDSVDYEIIWEIIIHQLPFLKTQLEKILTESV